MKLQKQSSWGDLYAQDTLLARGLGWKCQNTGAIVPPIHLATTFMRNEQYEKNDERGYIRDDSLAFEQAAKILSQLEYGSDALLFSSGMSAIMVALTAYGKARILVQDSAYFGVAKLIDMLAQRFDLEFEYFRLGDLEHLEQQLKVQKTHMVWIETPSNPVVRVVDIKAFADLAHRYGALLGVDSTVATPMLTQPIRLGADLVCHSATKYLNGHSDVLAGALVGAHDHDFWQKIREMRFLAGPLPGSFECYLLVRGMRTLHLRMLRHCESAMKIAHFLETHPNVKSVSYPGLTSHIDHKIACRQMQGGFGGLMSFRVKGGQEYALKMLSKLKIICRCTSFGGVESVIEHRHTVEQGTIGTPEDLLRLSIGIENVNDLIADLDQALS